MAQHSARQVAARILAHHFFQCGEEQTDPSMTPMKLQKLLYYAQGGYLAVAGESLFNDELYAWKYGPVVKGVYHDYKEYGNNPILEVEGIHDINSFSPMEKDVINQVLEMFEDCSAEELSKRSHSELPWQEAFSRGKDEPLDTQLIKKFFEAEYLDDGKENKNKIENTIRNCSIDAAARK